MAQNLDQFIAAWNGKLADFDGWYGAQCVDLFNYYERDVIGGPFVPGSGAKDIWLNYPQNLYTKVPNNMSDPNQLPARGDVMIWGGNLAGSGGYGHVGIVLAADKSGFNSFDQNFPHNSAPHDQRHTWDNTVLGWLHPNANGGGAPSPSAPAPAPASQQYIRIMGDFRTLWNGLGVNKKAVIYPNQSADKHYDYPILEWNGAYVKVNSPTYGIGWFYAKGATVDAITQFYNA